MKKGSISKRVGVLMCAVALGVCMLSGGSAKAQTAYYAKLRLDDDLIADLVKGVLNDWVSNVSGLSWRGSGVTVSKNSNTSIKIKGYLRYKYSSTKIADVDISLTAYFSCYWGYPQIGVTLSKPHLDDISLSSLIPPITKYFIEELIKDNFKLEDYVSMDFADELNINYTFKYCPRFSVASDGDVTVDFTPGTACTNGATKHQNCPINMSGSGMNYKCFNRYWVMVSDDCEPISPTGIPY